MKVAFFIVTFFSLPIMAQQYKAPKLNKLHWKNQGTNSYVEQERNWNSDYGIRDSKYPTDADENSPRKLRAPSSGEEPARPQHWDFKAVK